jgi:hypothetical protein
LLRRVGVIILGLICSADFLVGLAGPVPDLIMDVFGNFWIGGGGNLPELRQNPRYA